MRTVVYVPPAGPQAAAAMLSGAESLAPWFNWRLVSIPDSVDVGVHDAWMAAESPVGVIVAGTGLPPAYAGLPMVRCGIRPAPAAGCNLVECDLRQAATMAAGELAARGVACLAWVGGDSADDGGASDAFAAAAAAHGIATACFEGEPGESQPDRFRRLQHFLRQLPQPCGVGAPDDSIAAEVVAMAELSGIVIPDSLAVLGIGDCVEVCDGAMRTLSSVELDYRTAGMLAVALLAEAVVGRTGLSAAFGGCGIMRRESTPPAPADIVFAEQVRRSIRNAPATSLSAARAAESAGLSRRTAERRFRRATGETLLAAVAAERRRRAEMLLAHSPLPFKAVAACCGFADANSLRRFLHDRGNI